MKINLIVGLSIFLLVSCRSVYPNFQDVDFLTEKPQPSWRKNLYTFPKELQGLWVNEISYESEKQFEIDSTWIGKNTYRHQKYFVGTTSFEEFKKSTEEGLSEEELWELLRYVVESEYPGVTLIIENEPLGPHLLDNEGNLTLRVRSIQQLSLSKDVFLRKVNKNTIALNYRHPEGRGWKTVLIKAEEFK
ncbi:hypothetical protein [Fontibacter flavus]|uniref:Lipoprotein n=1 Tax=Fontibacter flavus TaxID=654838 RepID=A0ABV6FWA9_9BACT